MTSGTLEIAQHGAVRLLTIADPPCNVMSVAFMNDLEKEVAAIAAEGLQAFMQKRKPVLNK